MPKNADLHIFGILHKKGFCKHEKMLENKHELLESEE